MSTGEDRVRTPITKTDFRLLDATMRIISMQNLSIRRPETWELVGSDKGSITRPCLPARNLYRSPNPSASLANSKTHKLFNSK